MGICAPSNHAIKKESPERGVLCTYRRRQVKDWVGTGITEARDQAFLGGFASSREFEKLEKSNASECLASNTIIVFADLNLQNQDK